ncbi:2-amino-4-hydroxy-6-hydroxymethyldihydropteridine diphosphokinase [Thermosulfurimonas sp. F29]|uniref:2-amino-4-hydroxy-6- hydroxymethyldihydropteridine diphosphokinase n=1 Tax=Thermosulfurimonas sp. F29 TaxID=2867247 RepID=UPI001C8377C6|nr:2-amino-4-hydroxy-6-hydroxymethyldihydropteridine diphosphokinase [Thermosulfurimonas sp. F29]MBX6423002.1 2-amino-4-hydroxy-6-hydroxymethyldihydropteridine diphosphokinase [Thermosulfurimonas sp. F29]
MRAYLGLGSNLGDRAGNLHRALEYLSATPGVRLGRVSSLYLTEPVGFSSPNWFYNLVVTVETSLSAWELVSRGLEIELRLGRRRGRECGDRVLDIDLLFYGDLILREEWVQVPHPRLHERAFVLAPLCEIAPDLRHPVFGKTVRELWENLENRERVVRMGSLTGVLPKRERWK